MGRRSVHTAEELRELILTAATGLIESGGLASLSAREIARRIEYSPGTLYNVFENLDDLVLTIEGRMLDALADRLSNVSNNSDPRAHVKNLAEAYLQFTHDNPRLWNLLFEHHLPADRDIPDWYQAKLDDLMGRIETALQPLLPNGNELALNRAARVLWAGVHGITTLSTTDKLSTITADSARPLVDNLVDTYLAGLNHLDDERATKPSG
ncbi:MAG: TetR/AcrR family transcriptional regulator [Hyphomicrobiaceae bacterium]